MNGCIVEQLDPLFGLSGHLRPLLNNDVVHLVLFKGRKRHELGILDRCIKWLEPFRQFKLGSIYYIGYLFTYKTQA